MPLDAGVTAELLPGVKAGGKGYDWGSLAALACWAASCLSCSTADLGSHSKINPLTLSPVDACVREMLAVQGVASCKYLAQGVLAFLMGFAMLMQVGLSLPR